MLTDREAEVLTLLARGKSNKEIGSNLFISETTVKGHLRNIFTKLNVLMVRLFCFCIPRIFMHRCSASTAGQHLPSG